jgi:hypothetical protein
MDEVPKSSAFEQPDPARPGTSGPTRHEYVSEMSEAEFETLLRPLDRARTVAPHLQRLMTAVLAAAIGMSIIAIWVFLSSHFVAMDALHGMDAKGRATFPNTQFNIVAVTAFSVAGALIALAGVRLDLQQVTRAVLVTAGSVVMALVGVGVALWFVPTRNDLRHYYHVGSWGSAASFSHLLHLVDALGLAVAGCAVVAVVVMAMEWRRLTAAYPGRP